MKCQGFLWGFMPGDSESEDPGEAYDELLDQLEELEEVADSKEERRLVRESIRAARRAATPRVFGRVIRGFDLRDAGEAFVGSLVFGIPMLVEQGTLEIGEFISTNPLYFLLTLLMGVGITIGILYVVDFQRVEIVNPIFGVVPRRLVGILAISFGTATIMMTVWGRVSWGEPWLALCQVTVTFVVMAIGASLGDILPGT